MRTATYTLPQGLFSERRFLRAKAFQALVDSLWHEDDQRPGQGALREQAVDAVDALADLACGTEAERADRAAWLLGLLFEAQAPDPALTQAVHDSIRKKLPQYLDAFDRLNLAKTPDTEFARLGGLFYLLGHFPEAAGTINERLGRCSDASRLEVQSIEMIFATATSRPERSRFLLTYLGAKASGLVLDRRLPVWDKALACPACQSPLRYQENAIACTHCIASYRWFGDIPDLVLPGCTDPQQYPESIVGIYETQSRPRFVRTMADDWSGHVTPSREEAYLVKFLNPVSGPVLDLACGAGGWTKLVAQQVGDAEVIALDYSLAMLKACSAAVPGITPVRASASSLPVANCSLGGANCSDALQALPDPERALSEVSRCLRPGAPFTVFTFREAQAPYAYFQHRLPANARILFSDEQVRALADRTGFDIVDMSGPAQALFFTLRKRA